MSTRTFRQSRPRFDSQLLLIASPLFIIAAGHIVAWIAASRLGPWAWLPLQLFYWCSLASLCWISGWLPKLLYAYRRRSSWGWWAASIAVGLIPLPILLRSLPLLRMRSLVVYWLVIALINPVLEETFWRGVLGTATNNWPLGLSLAYTSLLFASAHPLLWGVFSMGNRSWETFAALLVMGAIWHLTFRRTGSLQAITLSHCLVDIGNMTVWVFLNLYVPPT